MRYQSIIIILCLPFVFLYSPNTNARPSTWFGLTVGADYEFGRLGNPDRGIADRDMGATSIKALPGWRLGDDWLVGLDLNYTFQRQITSVADAGNTDWAGKGYLAGIGAQYYPSLDWALQLALDFIGEYDFDRDTVAGQNDVLRQPLSLKAKAHYFLGKGIPISVDAVVGYTSWGALKVGGVEAAQRSNEWIAGLGLTYHFGRSTESEPVSAAPAATPVPPPMPTPLVPPPLEPTPSPTPSPTPQSAPVIPPSNDAEPSDSSDKSVITTEKTATGLRINIASAAFATGSSKISGEFRDTLSVAAKGIATGSVKSVTVRGHTDNTGSAKINARLSKERAENVKAILVESGIPSEKISVFGIGAKKPIATNTTREGREQNRRVEIEVEN